MTPAGRLLWHHLRTHRFVGLSVRRQAPVGPFIVDFLIPSHGHIIEADSSGHSPDRDAARDAWRASQGFRILLLWNRDVLTNLPGCLDSIAAHSPEH